jgi:hypothetical protein
MAAGLAVIASGEELRLDFSVKQEPVIIKK